MDITHPMFCEQSGSDVHRMKVERATHRSGAGAPRMIFAVSRPRDGALRRKTRARDTWKTRTRAKIIVWRIFFLDSTPRLRENDIIAKGYIESDV